MRDTGDEILVEVTTQRPGFVVIADSLGVDFEASVDSSRTEILDADYAVGAVYVPEGTHQVHLRYNPEGSALGMGVSAGSALMLTGVLLVPPTWSGFKRRRLRAMTVGRRSVGEEPVT